MTAQARNKYWQNGQREIRSKGKAKAYGIISNKKKDTILPKMSQYKSKCKKNKCKNKKYKKITARSGALQAEADRE